MMKGVPVVLVRYGEIAVKGVHARIRMERLLVHNITWGLKREGVKAVVKRLPGRIVIETDEGDIDRVVEVVRRVFGVKSLSPTKAYTFKALEDIVQAAVQEWRGLVEGRKFAVRASRIGEHPFKAHDVVREVGAALRPYSAGVDLENPDVELNIEIRGNTAFLYTKVIRGPGGLPLGCQGKVLALISGGFDSPVAAWLMMRRGAHVDALFISLAYPIDVIRFLRVAGTLFGKWSIGYDARLHIVDGTQLVYELRRKCNPHLFGILFKRILYEVAAKLAKAIRAMGIVTGESLGQVSSQTLANLQAAEYGIDIPIYRPLIGFDKDEIIEYSRMIGTYEESSKAVEFCALFSEKPRTFVTVEELMAERQRLDPDLPDRLLRTMVMVRASTALALADYLEREYVSYEIKEVPEGAIVIDLRDKTQYETWHYPGAINARPEELPEIVEKYGFDRTYVLYCDRGYLSTWGVLVLRRMGVKAYWIDIEGLRRLEARARAAP